MFHVKQYSFMKPISLFWFVFDSQTDIICQTYFDAARRQNQRKQRKPFNGLPMYTEKNKSGKYSCLKLMESYRNEKGILSVRTIKSLGRYEALIRDNPDSYEEL